MPLTPEQQAIVQSEAPLRVVIAGAGTGKTKTMVDVIADLVSVRRRSSGCIVAVSFTRNAARELRERVVAAMDHAAGDIWGGTSHSLALAIARSAALHLGLPATLTIYDDEDLADVIRDTRERLRLPKARIKQTQQAMAVERGAQPADGIRPEETRVAHEVIARMRSAGGICHDDMIPLALRVLRESEAMASYWQYRCRYLIVDEAQDTSPEEEELFAALRPTEMVCVGDPRQAIYGFRGCSVEHLLERAAEPEAGVFGLTLSWRSDRAVVGAANGAIRGNPEGVDHPLVTRQEAGIGEVSSATGREATLIHAVDTWAQGSLAVLARTNRLVDEAAEILEGAGHKVKRLSQDKAFYSAPEVRAFHAMLRLRHNGRDEAALRALMRERAPWTEAEVMAARRRANQDDVLLIEALDWEGLSWPTDLLEVAGVASENLAAWYRGQGRTGRAERVERAASFIEEWAELHGSTSLEEWLDHLQSRELWEWRKREAAEEEDAEAIVVGTIHAAKGLEWDSVVIYGAEQGTLPSDRAPLEEERRLAYVAVTRARQRALWITREGHEPSQFIGESMG